MLSWVEREKSFITSGLQFVIFYTFLSGIELSMDVTITKTRLFKHIENFTIKNWKFSDKNSDIFIFLLKT